MSLDVVFVVVRSGLPDAEVYGGEKSTLATASALRDAGFRPRFVITAHDRYAEEIAGQALSCEVVPVGDPFAGLRGAPWRERLARIGAILRVNASGARGRPAIIHTAAVPGFFCGWAGARLSGAKVIFHVRGASRNQRTRWFESLAIFLSDRTITVSEGLRRQLLDTGAAWLRPVLAPRIVAVYNGFDFPDIDRALAQTTRAEALARSGLGPDAVNLLLVGGISVDKGQLRFIEDVLPGVAREVPGVHLTFVGGSKDDAYTAACHAALARTGLGDHVTFTGYQGKAGVYRCYRAADILVLPSLREGLPRCAIEAQAFGLPVVATAVVGTAEAVLEGTSGLLVPAGRVEDMIEPVIRLARDALLRQRMGRAGAAHVRARFDMGRNVEGIARVYRELVS